MSYLPLILQADGGGGAFYVRGRDWRRIRCVACREGGGLSWRWRNKEVVRVVRCFLHRDVCIDGWVMVERAGVLWRERESSYSYGFSLTHLVTSSGEVTCDNKPSQKLQWPSGDTTYVCSVEKRYNMRRRSLIQKQRCSVSADQTQMTSPWWLMTESWWGQVVPERPMGQTTLHHDQVSSPNIWQWSEVKLKSSTLT